MVMTAGAAFSQTFTWTTNDSVVENLALNTTVQFPLHQAAVGTDTVTLAIEVIYNDLPATWDGMLCIYGTCLGTIPVVGTQATMNPISGAIEGMVRLTVNPLNGTEVAKLKVYVYDVDFPNDGDTATFILNTTLNVEEANALSEGLKVYPNPVIGSVQLEANTNLNGAIVYNLAGQEMVNFELDGMEASLNLESLETGSYFILITDELGNRSSQQFNKE